MNDVKVYHIANGDASIIKFLYMFAHQYQNMILYYKEIT